MCPKLNFRVVGRKGKFYREVVEPFLSYTRAKNLRSQRRIQEIGRFEEKRERERERERKGGKKRGEERERYMVLLYKSIRVWDGPKLFF